MCRSPQIVDGKDCVAVEHVVETQPLKPTNNPPVIISAEKETTVNTKGETFYSYVMSFTSSENEGKGHPLKPGGIDKVAGRMIEKGVS